jgi:hypothetical protein
LTIAFRQKPIVFVFPSFFVLDYKKSVPYALRRKYSCGFTGDKKIGTRQNKTTPVTKPDQVHYINQMSPGYLQTGIYLPAGEWFKTNGCAKRLVCIATVDI